MKMKPTDFADLTVNKNDQGSIDGAVKEFIELAAQHEKDPETIKAAVSFYDEKLRFILNPESKQKCDVEAIRMRAQANLPMTKKSFSDISDMRNLNKEDISDLCIAFATIETFEKAFNYARICVKLHPLKTDQVLGYFININRLDLVNNINLSAEKRDFIANLSNKQKVDEFLDEHEEELFNSKEYAFYARALLLSDLKRNDADAQSRARHVLIDQQTYDLNEEIDPPVDLENILTIGDSEVKNILK